jgi:hypothetical protein
MMAAFLRAAMAHTSGRARSGGDGLDQRFDAEDVDHPLHIIGQNLVVSV